MGRRSATATVVAILSAFHRRRRWSQAVLAREVGVTVPALRRHLIELCEHQIPLSAQTEHPHVYWALPRDWVPGGRVVAAEDIGRLLRLLPHAPRTTERDRLIERLVRGAAPAAERSRGSVVMTPALSRAEEAYLPLVEDAALGRLSVRVHYFSASRGEVEWRHVSPQRVSPGPPARFSAVCHRDGRLKWFRVDNILEAVLDPSTAFRPATTADLDRFTSESIHGFNQRGQAAVCSFLVRHPEARWVRRNLPEGMAFEDTDAGLRVSATTAGVLPLARFVVGLGAAARAETPELRSLVEQIARGALGEPVRDPNGSNPVAHHETDVQRGVTRSPR